MNDENDKEKPTNMEKIIVEYIYNHPNVGFRDLKRALTKDSKQMTAKTLKFYLYGEENPNNLYDKKHILANGERVYNGKKYHDIFEFNEAKIKYYPDLMKKTHIILSKKLGSIAHKLITNQTDKYAYIIDMLMQFGIDIELVQNPIAKKIYLSDLAAHRLSQILKLMIYECFLNNPDVWYVLYESKDFFPLGNIKFNEFNEKKNNLDFSINIKLNFSEIPHFYERLGVLLQFRQLDRDLYDNAFMRKYYSLIKDKKRNRRLEHTDFKSFYANAKFENEEREKLINAKKKIQKNKREFKEMLENYEDEIFGGFVDDDLKIGDLWADILNKQKINSNNKKN